MRAFQRGLSRAAAIRPSLSSSSVQSSVYSYSLSRSLYTPSAVRYAEKQEEETGQTKGFVSREAENLREFFQGNKADPRLKRVNVSLDAVRGLDWNRVLLDQIKKEEEKERLAKLQAEEEDKEYEGPTDIVFVGKKQTVWDQRIEYLKDNVLGLGRSKVIKLRRKMDTSDNPLLVRVREGIEDVKDRVEDVSEAYETTQHPLVWKVRDVTDNLFGETEEGWAMGVMKETDPNFNMLQFLEEMEEYMIPVVIDGYLRGDKALTEVTCEGSAHRNLNKSYKERETLGHYWDTRILDIHSLDCEKVIVHEDTPLLSLRFFCQHVKCHRDEEGEVVLGSEYDVTNVLYMWILRRDYESEYFNYKIVEFQTHEVLALV